MHTRTLRIFGSSGSGKKTLTGQLIHKWGDLGVPALEQMGNKPTKYEEILPFFSNQALEMVFYTPSFKWTITDDANFDTVFYLVDVTNAAEELDYWVGYLGAYYARQVPARAKI